MTVRPAVARRRFALLVALAALLLTLVLSSAVGAAGSYTLLVSTSSNRSNATALDDKTVSGNIFAFTSPDTADITRVRFWLDTPQMTGTPRRTESTAPYDFAGGTVATANPFDTRTLANGTHTITAAVDLADGTTSVATATFTVQNGGTPSGPLDQIHLAWVGNPATTLDVIWHTADPSVPHEVQYRKTGDLTWITATGVARPSGTAGVLHEVQLTGLTPGTSYDYRVRGPSEGWSSTFETRTAPAAGPASFDAVYVADTGIIGRPDGLATGTDQVLEEIGRLNPLLLLGGGDYAYFNTDSRFSTLNSAIDAWFNQMQPLAARFPLMPAYGNHEGDPNLLEDISAWTARFATPTGFDSRRNYSFDIGDVHFVSVYAVHNTRALPSATATWLREDLQAAKNAGKRWLIPFFHVAPFATSTNHPSNLALRAQLGPIFEQLGVKVAIFSHDQSYERTYPLVDVPTTNTPTSTAKSCYTMADGVSWVKVSPGGKLSNISQGFSPWASPTLSAFTAVRDNTQHHFTRIRVSAAGELTVEIYGLEGDGTPATVIDSFKYTTGSCPPAPPSTHSLLYSTSSNRSGASTLDGKTVSGNIFAFTSPDTVDITRVRFWLDNPQMTGTPRRIENTAPYDFTGGTVATANPFDTRTLAEGPHTITATVDLSGGTTEVLNATFTVRNSSSPSLAFTPTTLGLSAPQGGAPVSKTSTLAASDGSSASFALSDDASWLTVSPASGTAATSVTATADPSGLAPGTYSGTVTAHAPGYTSGSLSVTLTVITTGSYSLLYSTSSNRSNATALDGKTVSGNIFAFTSPDTADITRVRFWLDTPQMTGTPRRTESTAPYDFAGGTVATANPFDTRKLANGTHTITAAVDLADGTTSIASGTFTVNNALVSRVARPLSRH